MVGSRRVLGPRGTFLIRIFYREPTYARRAGAQDTSYRWTYKIMADSEEQAKWMATAEFRKMERLSSVGWSREIAEIAVLD